MIAFHADGNIITNKRSIPKVTAIKLPPTMPL
jgi:hypothetical protein